MTELFPAIDLRDGRCVRLTQGDFDRQTIYDDDPVAVAVAFDAAGAPWIHVVDLDAARTGRPGNLAVVLAIAAAVGVPVQSGGGVRDEASALRLLDAGVTRVVVGTAAVERSRARGPARRPGAPGGGRPRRQGDRGRGAGLGGGQRRRPGRPCSTASPAPAPTPWWSRVATTAPSPVPTSPACRSVLDRSDLPARRLGRGRLGWTTCTGSPRWTSGGRRVAGVIVGKALYDGALTVEEAACTARRPAGGTT